jgi:hypothetical protein
MDIQTLLKQHSEGFYDAVFADYRNSQSAMTGYVVHTTDAVGTYNPKKRVSGACHAGISSAMDRANALAVITMADNRLEINKGAIKFYDWLINKSFFSDVFLCKDVELSLKYGFVKRVDVSAAKWLGAAQLSRLSTSEFKNDMKAVYDIMASDFDIHPLLLLYIATELGFVSDGKHIKATKSARMQHMKNCAYSTNSAHLPFCYLDSSAKLKEICKDDPNKPFTWNPNFARKFNESSWPNNSNTILCAASKEPEASYETLLTNSFKGLLEGTASMLFNATVAIEQNYSFLWEDAVTELKSKVLVGMDSKGGVPINLSTVELLSKQLKLGE